MADEKSGGVGSRYTQGQKVFFKLDKKKLTDEDLAQLHMLLLPRTAYLPATEEECAALAAEIIGEENFAKMTAFAKEVGSRFGTSGCWGKGDKFCMLYYRLRAGGKTVCSLGMKPGRFFCILQYGKGECEKFEELRESFPRGAVQWTYDFANVVHGVRRLSFSMSDKEVLPHLMRLIAIKRNPAHPAF